MNLLKNIALYFVTVCITFGFVDLFMNITGIIDLSNLDYSQQTGVDYKPSTRRIVFNEGFSIVDINSQGIRGPEITLTKAPNTFRIALLGDSFIEGLQVMDRHHLRHLLEKGLSKSTGKNIEVLNFGYSGSEFSDMYARYELKAKNFTPDLTLYFVGTNDMKPQLGDPLSPVVKLEKDQLLIDNVFDPAIVQRYNLTKQIKQKSTLVKMISNCIAVQNEQGILPILLDKLYPSFNKKSLITPNIKPSQKTYELHQVTKSIIKKIDPSSSIIINRKEEAFPAELYKLLQENNIEIIELTSVFEQLKKDEQPPYFWKATKKSGHWNQVTHQAIASYLTIILSSRIN